MLFPAAISDSVVVKLLRQEYKRRAEFRPLLWNKSVKLHLDEVHTRLKIVARRNGHGDSEIDLGKIFCRNKGEGSMVLAEGSPGIGKTTLCLKLAYDWANESMPSTFPVFELVLLLKCRDLDGEIMEAIFEQLLPVDMEEKTKKRLRNFIENINSQERILIILDGLDELPGKSRHDVDLLLNRRILPFCYVLTTTRQEKGIEAWKQFSFDIRLLIEGFSEENSLEYIRKHFNNVDPSKGERLIEETKENTSLHALQNNPLNLLLLCVVYEEYEGKLPSSRTNLFQIIVRCLLRRYCEKNSVKACKKDRNLEKQFEADLLVLGELAWKCLLSDRHGFREGELKKFERSDDKLVVRNLGLVYKEESLKRLKPRHEYFFLHKSFQEYLAATHIAHKLQRNQFNVFEHVDFDQVTKKFPQVFLFVCGILREEASILFTQIGEELKSYWEWGICVESKANFFVESSIESGNLERMADVLFSRIPFPRVVHLYLAGDDRDYSIHWNLARVLCSFTGFFSKVQIPAEVHVAVRIPLDITILRDLVSLPNLKSLDFSVQKYIFGQRQFFQDISKFTSLLELTLPSAVESEIAAEYLTTNKTLEKVTFALVDESDEGWAKALDAGLCADTPLSSVGVRIHGSLSPTALRALKNLLFNKSLSSLSIYICGDMQDSLAEALATSLEGQIAVKVVDLCVNGKLSLYGANLIERGIVENNSRTKLIVSLRGEVPDNWQAVGRNIYSLLGEKTSASFTLSPNTFGEVTASPLTRCCPFEMKDGLLAQQNLTLNVWGEFGGDGAEALFKGLSRSPLSHLTLNIYGKLTDDILKFTARLVDERRTLSSLTINAWEQLTKEGKNLFKELKLDKDRAVTLNVRDVPAPPKESRDIEFVSIDDLESLIALFKEAKSTGKQHLSTIINIKQHLLPRKQIRKNSDLGNGMDAGAARNTALIPRTRESQVLASNTTLNDVSLTFSDDDNMSFSWAFLLGDGLARNTSLRNLTLRINCYGVINDISAWRESLRDGLERNTSLKNLSLIIENHTILMICILDIILEGNTSVENLFLTLNNFAYLGLDLGNDVGDVLAGNKSLKNLTLTFNNFGKTLLGLHGKCLENKSIIDASLTINNYGNICGRRDSFAVLLCQLKSLTTLNLSLNLCCEGDEDILLFLLRGVMENESLKTLRLKVNDPQTGNGSRRYMYDFSDYVVMSPFLSLIELTLSFYGGEKS